jgi:hypothetical protein
MRSSLPFFSVLLFAVAAAAQSLSGTFVNSTGQPVANVDVILSNGAPTGTTDAAGHFLITGLRNRTYTIQVNTHNDLLASQQFDFNVSGAASLGTRTLGPAFPVSATLVGPTGAGLLGVNMNVYLLDGTKLFTPHDGTDAAGHVVIAVPANTPVRVRAVPPVGTNLVPFEQEMLLSAPAALGTITLRAGFTLSGNIVDQNSSIGIGGCQMVTTNMLTGEIVVQLNALSATLTGQFSVLVPFGLYQIDIIPPTLNAHAGKQLFGVIGTASTSLGLVRLAPAALLIGTVMGPGGPVAGADIDVYTTGNDKLFTPGDNTNAAGQFSVMVPFGAGVNYSVRVDPQPGSGLVGARTAPFAFAAQTNVGTINVAAGVPLTLSVRNADGGPVADAHLNMFDPATGAEIITPGNTADAAGNMVATVPIGTWNVKLQAPQGSLWAPVSMPNVPIGGPLTTTVVLSKKPLECNLEGLGILTVQPGGEIFVRFSFQNTTPVTIPAIVDGYVMTPDGAITPWVPPLSIEFFPQFGMGLDFWVPTPVMTPADHGRLLRFFVRLRDFNGNVLDEAYVHFVIG